MFKIKRLLRLCVFFSLCCLPTELFAGIFDIPQTDKSVELLGIILGSNVGTIDLGGGGSSPMLIDMFEKFNIIIISIATVVLSYIGIVSTINTAQEGQVMGKKWSSIWIPLRSLIGILLMVPTPGSGYSMIQVTVLWIILQGVGAADEIWNIVLSNLEKGVSATGPRALDEGQKTLLEQMSTNMDTLAQQLLYSAVCMETFKLLNANKEVDANGNLLPISDLIQSYGDKIRPYTTTAIKKDNDRTYESNFNVGVKGNSSLAYICGSYKITATVAKDEVADQNEATKLAETAHTKKQQLMSTMFSYLLPNAKMLVKRSAGIRVTSDANSLKGRLNIDSQDFANSNLLSARDAYFNGVTELVAPNQRNTRTEYKDNVIHTDSGKAAAEAWGMTTNKRDPMLDAVESGRKSGWISAGAYYFIMTRAQLGQKLLKTAFNVPAPIEVPGLNKVLSVPQCDNGKCFPNINNTNIYKLLENYIEKATIKFISSIFYDTHVFIKFGYPSRGGASSTLGFGDNIKGGSGETTPGLEAVQKANKNAMEDMQSLLNNSNAHGDPLLQIAQLGGRLMLGAEIALIIYLAIVTALTIASAAASTTIVGSGTPWWVPAMAVFSTISGLIYTMLGALWMAGASMSIYVPMVPYMVFTLSAIGWLMLVIEAVVAAPIFSLSMVVPSGDELGKLVTGIGLLAGILLRPTLMIFGFVLAIRLFGAVIKLVNFGMADAMGTITDTGSMFSGIAVMCFYAGFIMALVNKCFALIHVLPDKVLTWIGVGAQSTGDEQTMGAAKGAMEAGAKATEAGMSGAASGASKGSAEGVNAAASNKISANKDSAAASKQQQADNLAKSRHQEMMGAMKGGGGGGGTPPKTP